MPQQIRPIDNRPIFTVECLGGDASYAHASGLIATEVRAENLADALLIARTEYLMDGPLGVYPGRMVWPL
jgi:hypothetical protein